MSLIIRVTMPSPKTRTNWMKLIYSFLFLSLDPMHSCTYTFFSRFLILHTCDFHYYFLVQISQSYARNSLSDCLLVDIIFQFLTLQAKRAFFNFQYLYLFKSNISSYIIHIRNGLSRDRKCRMNCLTHAYQ